MPRVIQVIESEEYRGKATDDDPVRKVRMIHDLEGNHLAEWDEFYMKHSILPPVLNPQKT